MPATGFKLKTLQLWSSCQRIAFITEIFISPINHFVLIGCHWYTEPMQLQNQVLNLAKPKSAKAVRNRLKLKKPGEALEKKLPDFENFQGFQYLNVSKNDQISFVFKESNFNLSQSLKTFLLILGSFEIKKGLPALPDLSPQSLIRAKEKIKLK